MKKLILIFISLFFIISACTKTDLRVQGFVNNSKGSPIENVFISIQKSKKILETQTDKTGYYRFENLPSGSWEFTVSKEGYETQTETFSFSAGSGGNIYTKNFELKQKKY
ncbi:MAG: carboxypeptidase-like regulatory domain-containing protein [Bacteroidetes bacterium]|nr:carboxypeptidase-like regulatory domain-containing protein [Bacteroidota bacterium]MCL1969684.1 carboxypeptidase-like regulatory domain-containing protein [Bacteroidota bacterium]